MSKYYRMVTAVLFFFLHVFRVLVAVTELFCILHFGLSFHVEEICIKEGDNHQKTGPKTGRTDPYLQKGLFPSVWLNNAFISFFIKTSKCYKQSHLFICYLFGLYPAVITQNMKNENSTKELKIEIKFCLGLIQGTNKSAESKRNHHLHNY